MPGVPVAGDTALPEASGSEDFTSQAEAVATAGQSGDEAGADLPDVSTDATGTIAPTPASSVPESEVPSATERAQSEGELERDGIGPLGRENEKVDSIEGKDPRADLEPYDAPGIRNGSFLIRPTLEAGVRYSNNPDDPTCDCFANRAETTVTMRAQSDWLRHSLNFEMRGTGHKSLANPSGSALAPGSDTGFRIAADGTLDISVADTATFSASLDRAREVLSSGSSTGYVSRPMQTTLRGAAGYSHDVGAIGLSVNAQVTRNTYGDAIDLTDTIQPQGDRDNTFASVTLRGTYDTSAIFSPFAEVETGRRFYDNKFDSLGTQRSANRYAGRVGLGFNRSEKLTGEMAVGWFVENPDDGATQNVSGLDMRGTVNWSPVRNTTVNFTAATAVEGASSATSESSVNYSASVGITRRMRPNLDANVLLSASLQNYTGVLASQTTLSAEAGATWWLNRYAGINGKVTYAHTGGTAGGARNTTGAYLGIILRR